MCSSDLYDEGRGCVGIGPSLSHKVIKREILDDVVEKIDKNIVLGGDAAIFYSSCLRAESICIIAGYGYFYRVLGMSVSHSYNVTYFNKIYTLYKYFEKEFSRFEKQDCLMEPLRKHLWHFLSTQIKQVFGLEFKNVYLFPYQLIDKGSRIILYGAGKVGQSYYEQIRKNAYCSIAAWADSNAYKEDENIISPMMIAEIEYSKIVIAIKSRKSAEEIIQSLVHLGVDREKIVWVEPPVMPLI